MAETPPELLANQTWFDEATGIAKRMRLRGFEYVMRNNGGYLSQICSAAEIFAYLYTRGLNIGESEGPMSPGPFSGNPGADNPDYMCGGHYNGPKTAEFDRFFFSPAHYALVLYVALIEAGRLAPEALAQFNKDGQRLNSSAQSTAPV